MANPLTGQFWYVTQGSTTDVRISYINADGSNATTLINGPAKVGPEVSLVRSIRPYRVRSHCVC
jgi:hypothetical protein